MENLKATVLSHSKKSSLHKKFSQTAAKNVKKLKENISNMASNTEYVTLPCTSSQAGGSCDDPLVASVLDMFPSMDKSLIKVNYDFKVQKITNSDFKIRFMSKKCLKYYNNNVEQVINALLENNLPIFSADEPTEEYDYSNFVPPEIEDFNSELSKRKNIFDNDEFDVFNKQAVDLSKIHIGKKSV
jgi:hypothetical protein